MRHFDDIWAIAADRKGGDAALEAMLSTPKTATQLAAIPPDRWLAEMTKRIFQAGFNWRVVENMWPGFEAAFHNFDIGRCAMLQGEEMDALMSNTDIVRNGPKIATVPENAVFIESLARDGEGIARTVADWPATDQIGLQAMFKKRGSRLGGATGQLVLRFIGKDSFLLRTDVVARLMAEGVVDTNPTSQKALRATQEAFNTWADQSGRPMTQISQVLAFSV